MPVLIPRESSTVAKSDRTLSTYISPAVVGKIYSIFLWDMNANAVFTSSEFDVTEQKETVEHFFTVPPKTLHMSEPFATHIVPTQHGGKYTESHGVLMRNIEISGTTGVRPNKLPQGEGRVGVLNPPGSGTASFDGSDGGLDIFTLNDVSSSVGLDSREITGHDGAMNLRNVFRVYSDLQIEGNSSVVMVWRNIKDGDYWIVEPVKFDLKQDSRSPFSYSYNISLKTLSTFTAMLASPTGNPEGRDPQEQRESVLSIAARMRARQQTLNHAYIVTLVNNNLFKGGAITSANEILKPMTDTVRGLEDVSRGVWGSSDFLLQRAETLAFQLRENLDKLSDLEDTTNVRRLRRFWRRSLAATYGILNEPSYRNTSQILISRRNRIQRAYAQPAIGTGVPIYPETGGSPTYLGNLPAPNNVSQDVVGSTDTIRTLAQRLCGDARKWQQLVVLNDLKAPYVDAVPSEGVLGPGDTILYPSTKSRSVPGVRLQDKNDQNFDNDSSTNATQLLDQTYGRDLRLQSNGSENAFQFSDLSVNQRGDISTIVGVDNVQQAIRIKFATEQGRLPMHPYFGARFAAGSKATTSSFNTFKLNTLTTLLSDDRIDEVKRFQIGAQGDKLFVSAKLRLVGAQDYQNTHFALRRF